MSENAGKILVILQSNYIPWKGYFDLVNSADEFLIFDDVQYTRRDWRNRNKIIQAGSVHWLTIPVASKGGFEAPINAMTIADPTWARKHWTCLRHAYAKAPYFDWLSPELEAAYSQAGEMMLLTEINEHFLRVLSRILGLKTPFLRAEHIPRQTSDPTGRLVELCRARGATTYVSGPAAKSYLDQAAFDAAGITLAYANYSGYPAYDQGRLEFDHGVSILDLLFRTGPAARNHLKTMTGSSPFLDARG